eukprot:14171-Hanusia_phi.AAC.1
MTQAEVDLCLLAVLRPLITSKILCTVSRPSDPATGPLPCGLPSCFRVRGPRSSPPMLCCHRALRPGTKLIPYGMAGRIMALRGDVEARESPAGRFLHPTRTGGHWAQTSLLRLCGSSRSLSAE